MDILTELFETVRDFLATNPWVIAVSYVTIAVIIITVAEKWNKR